VCRLACLTNAGLTLPPMRPLFLLSSPDRSAANITASNRALLTASPVVASRRTAPARAALPLDGFAPGRLAPRAAGLLAEAFLMATSGVQRNAILLNIRERRPDFNARASVRRARRRLRGRILDHPINILHLADDAHRGRDGESRGP